MYLHSKIEDFWLLLETVLESFPTSRVDFIHLYCRILLFPRLLRSLDLLTTSSFPQSLFSCQPLSLSSLWTPRLDGTCLHIEWDMIHSFLKFRGSWNQNWLSCFRISGLSFTCLYKLCSYYSESNLLPFKRKSCCQGIKIFPNPPSPFQVLHNISTTFFFNQK